MAEWLSFLLDDGEGEVQYSDRLCENFRGGAPSGSHYGIRGGPGVELRFLAVSVWKPGHRVFQEDSETGLPGGAGLAGCVAFEH